MADQDPDVIAVPRTEWEATQARLARLEAALEPTATAGSAPAADLTVPRRKMLAGLVAAAAAGTAAVVVGDAPPAAAAGGGFDGPVTIAPGTGNNQVAFSVNQTSAFAGPSSLFATAVPVGTINANTYAIGAVGPNGIQSQATREGIAVDARAVTGTAVKATLDSSAPTSAAAIHAITTNGIGVLASVSGQGIGLATVNQVGRGVISQSAASQLTLRPYFVDADPPQATGGPKVAGELYVDGTGALWYCTVSGSPGTWRKVGGPGSAGSFHVLPAPVRVYDSRPGTSPTVGSKTKLPAGGSRTLGVTGASTGFDTGVPQGATAVSVTCLLVNTAAGGGNFTIWANGVAKPAANTMVWGGNAGRFSSPAVTAVDGTGQVRVSSSLSTDFVLDVVGYYL